MSGWGDDLSDMTNLESSANNYAIDKLSAATIHLEAAFLLSIDSEYNEAIHTLIAAAAGIIEDLSKTVENPVLQKFKTAEADLIKDEYKKYWYARKREAQNYFKHADKDAQKILTGFDFRKLNNAEILIQIFSLWQLKSELSGRLKIAIAFFGAQQQNIFDLRRFSERYGLDKDETERILSMNLEDLKLWAREAMSFFNPTIANIKD